jgi:hypothetical protein
VENGKVSKQAVLVMMGMDNGIYYEENEGRGHSETILESVIQWFQSSLLWRLTPAIV